MRAMLKSKIRRACVTETNLDYEDSITIDKKVMLEADIFPGEKLQAVNLNNGARFTSYAIEDEPGSKVIYLNGTAARLVIKDGIIIILSYCYVTDEEAAKLKPRLVFVDDKNSIIENK